MKTNVYSIATALIAVAMFTSCENKIEEEVQSLNGEERILETRAFGDKTPVVTAYIEVNDVNPLNAGLYEMDGKPFIDVVKLFAANVHANGKEPSLYFNDKLDPVMADVARYIAPMQARGIKVLLSVLGDHQGVGVANLGSDDNARKFAEICAYAVRKYGLDGIDIDDEYAKYGENDNFPDASSGQLSDFIVKLRAALGQDKLITMFEFDTFAGNLSSAAVDAIDYGWNSAYGPYSYAGSSNGFPRAKWSPQALNLNDVYNRDLLTNVQENSSQAANEGMGAIMTYDLRPHTQCDPIDALNAIARGAYGTSKTVTRTSNTGFVRANPGPGLTITHADIGK